MWTCGSMSGDGARNSRSREADSCPSITDETNADRPYVANSSIAIPAGRLQIEHRV